MTQRVPAIRFSSVKPNQTLAYQADGSEKASDTGKDTDDEVRPMNDQCREQFTVAGFFLWSVSTNTKPRREVLALAALYSISLALPLATFEFVFRGSTITNPCFDHHWIKNFLNIKAIISDEKKHRHNHLIYHGENNLNICHTQHPSNRPRSARLFVSYHLYAAVGCVA